MKHSADVKLDLAIRGVRLDVELAQALGPRAQAASLELGLPGDVWVSAPIVDVETPFNLARRGTQAFLIRRDGPGESQRMDVRLTPRPRFYDRRTSRGTPMAQVGGIRGTHLVISPGATCGYSVRGTPCRFCLEGARVSVERDAIPVEDVLEVVSAAFEEGVADFVYFNSGFFDGDDGGIAFLAPYVETVRRHFDTLIAAQVHPPRGRAWIDRTYAMGVDALSYNLEIFDSEALGRHCVGRARYIGRDRYLESLAYAAQIFPNGTVWTDLALGLEPTDSTLAGIEALAAQGVVPVVSLVRGEHPMPAPESAATVLAHLYNTVKGRGINMSWVRDLGLGITPLEARHFAGDDARLTVTVQQLTRWRLGGFAARGLARVRRRLRVRTVNDSFDEAS